MRAGGNSGVNTVQDEPVEWAISDSPVPFDLAVAAMEDRVAQIASGDAPELVWLLEHPPLYTSGTSARQEDLSNPLGLPVHAAGRGGQFTYHGPGQRVAYVMLHVGRRGADVRGFVNNLEQWVIDTLDGFNIRGERREGRVGVWVDRTAPGGPMREDKIAAIGVRLRRWVSFHGVSLNVEPDLTHFSGIVPCGIAEPGLGVTSLADLGYPVVMAEADGMLRGTFERIFGATVDAPPPAGDAAPIRSQAV